MKIRLGKLSDDRAISSLLRKYAKEGDVTGDLSPRRIREKLAFRDDFFLLAEESIDIRNSHPLHTAKKFTAKSNTVKDGSSPDKFLSQPPASIAAVVRLTVLDIDLAEIRYLVVSEKSRGRGIASALLKQALSFLKKRGVRKVITRCKASNAAALSLFSSAGFQQEGYFSSHYRKGVDIVQLAVFLHHKPSE